MIKPKCTPQDDLDCYYNSNWKNLISSSDDNSNNFSRLQNSIDNFIFDYVMNLEHTKNNSNNRCVKNLMKLRDCYFKKSDYSPFLQKLIGEINAVDNVVDLAKCIRHMVSLNIDTLFSLYISSNFDNPLIYCITIGEFSSTMDDSEYNQSHTTDTIELFKDKLMLIYYFIKHRWNNANSNNHDKNKAHDVFTNNIIKLESLFSQQVISIEDSQNPFNTHFSDNYQTFLEKFDAEHFWENIVGDIMKPINSPSQIIMYDNPKVLLLIKNLILDPTPATLTMIKDYLIYCVFKKYYTYTTLYYLMDEFVQENTSAKNIFIKLFCNTFGYHLQEIYDKHHYHAAKTKYLFEMFNNIREYCIYVFRESNMFTTSTKKEAILKLQTLGIVIGKQEFEINMGESFDYNFSDDFFENLAAIENYFFLKKIILVGNKINNRFLSLSEDIYSFDVNAYYDPSLNVIYIPTSITNDLFLDLNKDIISNYGSIGAIIGHEITHCFDDYGRLFDYKGRLINWWSLTDQIEYFTDISKIKTHYDSLLFDGVPLKNQLSLSENISDIGGIKISFRAFLRKYLPNISTKNLNSKQKKYLQKYFESWAHTMRSVNDPDLTEMELYADVHSPYVIRTNAPFSHLSEYYDIFDVKPSDFNYLDPINRSKFMEII